MQEKIIQKNRRKKIAISEIILLITSIIAFSFFLGNSSSITSAYGGGASEEPSSPDVTEGFSLKKSPPYLAGLTFGYPSLKKALGLKYPPYKAPPLDKPITSTGTGDKEGGKLFGKLFKEGGFFNPPKFGKALFNAGITAGAAMAISFFATLIKTGDAGAAYRTALRVGIGAGVGYLAGYGLSQALAVLHITTGPAGWIVGAGVMLGILFSKLLSREQYRQIDFTCKPWQAQSGGADCDLCDNNDFPCTEYQCKSLGTGCEIINKDTDEPRCIWKNPNDVNPPEIQPWEDALIEGYEYVPLTGKYGVEIRYTGEECLPFFQPFTFGVKLDKDGYCRIESEKTNDFSEMSYDFGGKNLYMEKHKQQMTFPGVVHLEREAAEGAINLTHAGEYEFYVRCEAATNGKANRKEFLFKFCIDDGPDTTSPIIRGFNPLDNTPIAYFEEGEPKEVDVQVYVNEPSQCRWSHSDKDYGNMEKDMTCPNSLANINSQLSYTCYGKLTGFENSKSNKFFFRCNDTFGNVNIQSRTLTLIGTQPLFISSVEPNETTIRGSSDSIKVTLEAETSAGYKNGEATCEYSETGTPGSYVVFSDTGSHLHSTENDIWLGPGDYDFFIRCNDLAGNSDNKQISFTVETDTSAPIVVRVFRDGSNLKIITDEEASCVYDNKDCLYDFDDGISMTSDEKVHSTQWDPDKNFYIKCQDEFGNLPAPQSCSIIVKPFEV